jgi:hypothetical protein
MVKRFCEFAFFLPTRQGRAERVSAHGHCAIATASDSHAFIRIA